MFPQLCLALLALSSSLAGASNPNPCEELIKPLQDTNQISGKWILRVIGGGAEEHMINLKALQSSWIDISTEPSDNITLRFGDRDEGKCQYGHANITQEGNSTRMTFHFNSTSHDHVGMHLASCADCLLWADDMGSKGRLIQLFTKSGALADSDLALFRNQAACLDFPPDFFFVESKDLCPDEKDPADAAAPDADADAAAAAAPDADAAAAPDAAAAAAPDADAAAAK